MNITGGVINAAQKVVLYGPEGIGKSTFAAQFPSPLFIDTEGSTKHMDVRRLDAPESWTMLMEEVRYVRQNPDVCATLVIDSVDWAERLCMAQVCAVANKSSIEDFGYGKGYTYLAEEFAHLLDALTDVVDRGIHVVLVGHSQIRKFELPDEATAYDRWELKLQKKTAPLVKEWADMVLFANYKTFVTKRDDGKAKASGGQRVLYTTHRPTWDAKNRCGLPEEMPFNISLIAESLTPVKMTPAAKPKAKKAKAAKEAAAEAVVEPAPETEPVASGVPTGDVVFIDRDGSETVIEALPAVAVPPHLERLHQLMATDGVTEVDVRTVVADKGYFPKATPVDKYPADFVDGVLVGAWPQVLAFINAAKATA